MGLRRGEERRGGGIEERRGEERGDIECKGEGVE